jgi:hypothetical protein
MVREVHFSATMIAFKEEPVACSTPDLNEFEELARTKQGTVFRLRFVEDLECHEIAEELGISEGAVKTHLFRAVKAVRKTHRRRRCTKVSFVSRYGGRLR